MPYTITCDDCGEESNETVEIVTNLDAFTWITNHVCESYSDEDENNEDDD